MESWPEQCKTLMSDQCAYVVTINAVIGQITEQATITPPVHVDAKCHLDQHIKGCHMRRFRSHDVYDQKHFFNWVEVKQHMGFASDSPISAYSGEDRQAPGFLANKSAEVLQQHGSQC